MSIEDKNFTKIGEDGVTIKGGSVDYKSAVLDTVFNKTPISKLFLILSIFVYGIVAYSKREAGVSEKDLSVFIFFLIFVFIIFILFEASSLFYRRFLNSFFINDIESGIIGKCFKFFTKKTVLVVIIIIIVLGYLFCKENILNFLNNIIQNFG